MKAEQAPKQKLPIWKIIFAVGFVLAMIGFWFEPRSLTIKSLDVTSQDWPKQTAPLRVVLISDIHVDQWHMPPQRVRKIAQKTKELKPDIVILAGDYVGGEGLVTGYLGARARRSAKENEQVEEGLRALNAFDAPLGVYAAMGNHDCWWDCQRVREVLQTTKIKLLENNAVPIKRASGDVWVVGVEDGQTQSPDFTKAAQNVPKGVASLTIEHNPGLFDWASNHQTIQLSGHTHCGQVRLPLIGAVIKVSRHMNDAAKGWFLDKNRILIVTCGLGESGLPVRFMAAPQIMVLTIHSGAKSAVKNTINH